MIVRLLIFGLMTVSVAAQARGDGVDSRRGGLAAAVPVAKLGMTAVDALHADLGSELQDNDVLRFVILDKQMSKESARIAYLVSYLDERPNASREIRNVEAVATYRRVAGEWVLADVEPIERHAVFVDPVVVER